VAVANYAIATLAEAKAQLNIPTATTGDDTLIEGYIDRASGFCESYTGRKLAEQSISSEIHDGDGGSYIYPRFFPITQLSTETTPTDAQKLASVQYRTLPTDDWTNIETEVDYIILRTGEPYIELYANSFPAGTQNVRLAYKAGYTSGSIELNELKQVVVEMVQVMWNQHKGGNDTLGYDSRSDSGTGAASFSTSFRNMKPEWKAVLDRYRLRRV